MPSGRIEHGTIDAPEIVTEVNDSGQWEVQDSAGNVIARFDQDQAVNLFSDLFDAANTQTVYDSSAQEVPADVNNENTTAQVITLDQQADDGTDRVLITKADGTNMAEIYSDGTNTVINPISGNIDIDGALSAGSIGNGGSPVTLDDNLESADGVGLQSSENSSAFFAVTNHENLADGGKVQLTTRAAKDVALVFVVNRSQGDTAAFQIKGGFNSVSEIFDPSNGYTTTEDNDTTTNIYWDAGNSRYEINNETGGTRSYSVWVMG